MPPAHAPVSPPTPVPADADARRAVLSFRIPGDPVGKGRPRFVGGRAVTPTATRTYEHLVATIARAAHRGEPLAGPLAVSLTLVCARVGTRPRGVPHDVWRAGERVPRIGKPDVDNAAKAVLDGMVAGGVLVDDTHAVRLEVDRWYAAVGEAACVEVEVRAVGWATVRRVA